MPEIEKPTNQNLYINNKKVIIIITIILITIFCIYFLYKNNIKETNLINNDCFITKQRIIDGVSMTPLLKDGQTVTTYENYYDCHEIERKDIVIFNIKTQNGDFIKKVVGLPGDILEFENGYVKINKEFVLNSEGKKYHFSTSQQNILKIPLNESSIPRNGYFILGDSLNSGTFDSRQFGYISKDQIIGKVNN